MKEMSLSDKDAVATSLTEISLRSSPQLFIIVYKIDCLPFE